MYLDHFRKQKHEKGRCSYVDEYCSLWGINDWIKTFAKKYGMTIKMGILEKYPLDDAVSFFLKQTLLRP